MISPVSGVKLQSWSLKSDKPLAGPLWRGRDTYFIYYAYGLNPVPLVFSMDFKVIFIFYCEYVTIHCAF